MFEIKKSKLIQLRMTALISAASLHSKNLSSVRACVRVCVMIDLLMKFDSFCGSSVHTLSKS